MDKGKIKFENGSEAFMPKKDITSVIAKYYEKAWSEKIFSTPLLVRLSIDRESRPRPSFGKRAWWKIKDAWYETRVSLCKFIMQDKYFGDSDY